MIEDRFKFRVWDLQTKTMHEVFAIDWADGKPITCHTESKKLYQQFDHDTFVLMQSIGLKDKNGVLIFEGDIVNFEGRLIVIKWNIENKERFDGERSSTTYVGFSLGLYGLYENSFLKCEIIGNIYEQPELLKAGE